MADFHEIVDLQQFARAVRALAVTVPVLAILIGLIVGAARKRLMAGLVKGVAIGALGPIIYGLWLLYNHFIRTDPQTGTVGLHRVSVLLMNVAVFAVVGVLLGLAYRRVFRAAPSADAPTDPITHSE
jgi:chromate transport protein ChrA